MGGKEEVRARIDLAGLIGAYVKLSPAGPKRLKGLCPFHHEKTPSFQVDLEAGYYHCFGCKASGDAFSFLMAIEQLSFPEALQKLAAQVGVNLEVRTKREDLDLFQVNELALNYFQQERAVAFDYLASRGISRETASSFEVGYAPGRWDGLLSFARNRGLPERLLAEAGLLSESQERRFDRFRDRVIFPIRDALGRLVGFGGRVLGDGNPKYLNSPETAIFSKGKLLYGYHLARKQLQEEILVVEGYLDVLAMHQCGFPQTVATLGTALTSDHAALLERAGLRRVALMFDRDAAGRRATLAGLNQVIGARFQVRALELPGGKDAAEVLMGQGRQAVDQALEHGLDEVEVRIHLALEQFDRHSPSGQRSILQFLLPRMRSRDPLDEVARRVRERTAELLGLREEQLNAWVFSQRGNAKPDAIQLEGLRQVPSGEVKREWFLAQQILQDPSLLQKLDGKTAFHSELVCEIIEVARRCGSREGVLDHFRGRPEEPLLYQALFEDVTAHLLPSDKNQDLIQKLQSRREESLRETESRLSEDQLRQRIRQLRAQLPEAAADQQRALLAEIQGLQLAVEAERRGRKQALRL